MRRLTADILRGLARRPAEPEKPAQPGVPVSLVMMDDPAAERLWQVARKVNRHERIAPHTPQMLAALEFEEWDWITRSVDPDLGPLGESAVAAIVVAMRAAGAD